MQGCTFCGGGPSSKAMHTVLEGGVPPPNLVRPQLALMRLSIVPHLPLLGQYLGHTWGFDHESRPDGGAFDQMMIRCYSIHGGARWEI